MPICSAASAATLQLQTRGPLGGLANKSATKNQAISIKAADADASHANITKCQDRRDFRLEAVHGLCVHCNHWLNRNVNHFSECFLPNIFCHNTHSIFTQSHPMQIEARHLLPVSVCNSSVQFVFLFPSSFPVSTIDQLGSLSVLQFLEMQLHLCKVPSDWVQRKFLASHGKLPWKSCHRRLSEARQRSSKDYIAV